MATKTAPRAAPRAAPHTAPRTAPHTAAGRKQCWQDFWDCFDEPDTGLVAVHLASGLRVVLQDGKGVGLNAADIESAFLPKHGPHNAPAMVQRLLREGTQMLVDPSARGWRS